MSEAEAVAEESSEENQATESQDSMHEFFTVLPKTLENESQRGSFRLTNKGLFLETQMREHVVEAYRAWLSERGVYKSAEKCLRRLFNSDRPAPLYLLNGNQTMVGFMITADVPAPQKFDLPTFQGMPFDATTMLHPKDPLFSELDDVDIASPNTGIEIRFRVKNRQLRINRTTFGDFIRLAKTSTRIKRDYPDLTDAQRDYVIVLRNLLSKSRSVKSKDFIVIPGRTKKKKNIDLLRVGPYVFVVAEKGEIQRTYITRGKQFVEFIKEELVSLSKAKRASKMEHFRIAPKPGYILGEVVTPSRRYPLSMTAFTQFLSEAPDVHPKLEFGTEPYSVRDALVACSGLFQDGEIVPIRNKGKKDSKLVDKRLVRNAEFRVAKRNVIAEFAVVKGRRSRELPGGERRPS